MAMMKYSKGGDTTNVHVLYCSDCLSRGMYRVRGLALMAKSMQALCRGGRVRGLGTALACHPALPPGSPAKRSQPQHEPTMLARG